MVSDRKYEDNEFSYRLNPCCNGIWSQTQNERTSARHLVLILVVMEYGLRHKDVFEIKGQFKSLNPCCNGICSQTQLEKTVKTFQRS